MGATHKVKPNNLKCTLSDHNKNDKACHLRIKWKETHLHTVAVMDHDTRLMNKHWHMSSYHANFIANQENN